MTAMIAILTGQHDMVNMLIFFKEVSFCDQLVDPSGKFQFSPMRGIGSRQEIRMKMQMQQTEIF